MSNYRVEFREPGKPAVRVDIDQPVEVGREGVDVVLSDVQVSRRHLRLWVAEGAMRAADLGSSNGTWLNGARLLAEAALTPGDTLRLGSTEIEVLVPAVGGKPTVVAEPVTEPAPAPAEPGPSLPARPVLDELAIRETDEAVIRFRPGTAGEAAVPGVVTALRRARRRLAGLGSESWGLKPQVCLVDPFPDPDRPGEIITGGTVVDTERSEIWMVVTPESPPEPPERSLALLFGAAFPAANDLTVLLEGYGLHVAETPDPNPQLQGVELPPLGAADGELAPAMALSFVRFLLDRGSAGDFRRLLSESTPGRADATAHDIYGSPLAGLEEQWRAHVMTGGPRVKAGQFLRLSAGYLRPHVRREIEMFAYTLLGLAFTIVFPFAFRRLIDTAIPSGQYSRVLTILVLLGAAFAVSMVANLRRAYLAAYVSGSVIRQVRSEMFARLQALSAGWHSRRQAGDVLSRLITDVVMLERGLSEALRDGFVQLVTLVVSAVVLLVLNPLLAVIVLAGAPLVGIVYRVMGKGAMKRSLARSERTGGVLAVASESLAAQPVVRAFGLEARENARFDRASRRLFDADVRLQLFGGLFGLSVTMIMTMLRLVILGVGAWLILRGSLTLGGLVAFLSVMGEVIAPVTALAGIGEGIQAATGALHRVNEVREAETDVSDAADAVAAPPLEREIRLDGVGFSYTPERRTLDGVDAVIPAGSRVAFIGPTGAGKSSVLQLLMRFYDPDEGAVRIDGRDLRTVTIASWRSQLGVVFQDTFLFDTTIRENIALGRPGATDAEIQAAAEAAELHEFVMSLPRGYDTLVGERGSRLSGGQRQRLALARALVRNPRILLLDEATSALDPRTERLIAATLERVGEGRTTIAVTHRLASITRYDRIFVVGDGKLAEQGTHAELVRRDGVYAQLWSEQTGAETVEAAFDAAAALARVPLFAGLGPGELMEIAGRLKAADLAAGDTVTEGGGRLLLIRRGRARVLAPGVGGALVATAVLGPGDAFGVAALLGAETGALLEAVEPVRAVVLDDEALAAIAATHPPVAAVLEGQSPAARARPAGGRRLSRLTLGPTSPSMAMPVAAVAP